MLTKIQDPGYPWGRGGAHHVYPSEIKKNLVRLRGGGVGESHIFVLI